MATVSPLPQPLLEISELTVGYGGIQAIRGLNLQIHAGEILTLIGSNGAGKTTTLRAISGLLKPMKGTVRYRGEDLGAFKAHQIVAKRLIHVPEGRGIFLNLSVMENLDLGAWTASPYPPGSSFEGDLERVFQLFPRLKERRNQNAGTLSGGEQQMLAIGRALMGHPELLLLDEPSLGLAPQVIEVIFEIIRQINREGTTVLLVEQNALQALQVAHRGMVLETGSVILEGPASDLVKNDQVRKAYLGES